MRLGYNTNGLAHHRLYDAVELLVNCGYEHVAISIDHGCLAPGDPRCEEQVRWLQQAAERHGLTYGIETGARFLLDPRQKHEPTLVSADPARRQQRIEFYKHAIDVARRLDATCVSIWSGVLKDGEAPEVGLSRLTESLPAVLAEAAQHDVLIGFEPEPGMLVETLADYTDLCGRLDAAGVDTSALRLTIDLGHLHCNEEGDLPELLAEHASEAVNVHIEDMRRGTHEHLMFGEGNMDFPPLIRALLAAGYRGPLVVELSRHSHMAPLAASRSVEFLEPLIVQSETHHE